MRIQVTVVVVALLLTLAPLGASQPGFAPIDPAHKALREVSGTPGAPAVVLFERAYVHLMDYPTEKSSSLEAERRVKILTREGIEEFGEMALLHSAYLRLTDLEARTVLPDGREIPVPAEAVFEDQTSRLERSFVTKIVFPSVEVGAILDLKYTFHWNNFMDLEPWVFANRVPTLVSEVAYHVPPNLGITHWAVSMLGIAPEVTVEKKVDGKLLSARAVDLPAVPKEDSSFPLADLSPRFLLVPTQVFVSAEPIALMDRWESTIELVEYDYVSARKGKGKVKAKAKELVAGATSAEQKARAIHRFVRDEIRAEGQHSVFAGGDLRLDTVLEDRVGTPAHKGLLLQTMLDAVRIDSELIWAADRRQGRVDLSIANPRWFERVLVRAQIGKAQVLLDPVDRAVPFGRIAPEFESMPALVADRRHPEAFLLPRIPPEENLRQAEVVLAIDEEGEVEGSGSLRLGGHHAWLARRRAQDDRGSAEAWQEWLETRFEGWEIDGVEVSESQDEGETQLRWDLRLSPEAVLGDEVSLRAGDPMTIVQPFTLPVESRRTPVQLVFADCDHLDLEVTWPEGWRLEESPEPTEVQSDHGRFLVQTEIDAEARKLHYHRELDIHRSAFNPGDDYQGLRSLFAKAAASDQQGVLLSLQP